MHFSAVDLRTLVIWLIVALGAILALRGVVRALEPHLAFFPIPGETITPADYGVRFERLIVTTTDRERLEAWWLRHADPRAVILYLHGNGGNLSMWSDVLVALHGRGYDVVALDYRGYGSSTGRPTERGLYLDVEAFVGQCLGVVRTDAGRPLVYWGRSLGATAAAYATRLVPPDRLVLESGFPDARSVVRGSILWLLLPLASYRFPTLDWLRGLQAPVLVIHGTRDSVIPYALGQALYQGIAAPKTFLALEGGDHNDLQPPDPALYWRAVDAFIAYGR